MRVFEVVAAVSTGRTPVDATGGAVDGLRLPEGAEGAIGSTPAGGVVLVAPQELDAAALTGLLNDVPEGADVVAFLPTTPLELPVAVVIDALSASGVQAVEAVPVEHARFGVALLGVRSEGRAPVASYLSGREPVAADEAALRRIIAERVVEGLALRARLASLEAVSETEALKAELASTKAELAATKKKLDGIMKSPTYALARGIRKVKPSKG